MTCADTSPDIYEIDIRTKIDCPSHSIEPRTSATHHVQLTNLSPVSAEVQLRAECVGDHPLSYSGKPWQQTVDLLPARRWKRVLPVRLLEDITHDGTSPPQGGLQKIHVTVTTVPPSELRDIFPLSETYADISLYVSC